MARSNSTFLKVNQGDNGFGHLENIVWAISQHCPTEINFSLLHPSNLLIFPASVKLVPTRAGLLGTQLVMMRFGRYETQDSIFNKDFVSQVSVMRTKRL